MQEKKLIISKKEAKKEGLNLYFTGKPCRDGHFSDRYVANSSCVICARDKQSKYRSMNINSVLECNKRWREKNREKERDRHRIYEKKREKTPERRCASACRMFIHRTLRGDYKDAQCEVMLGYTSDELKAHLERQFARGMSWDNHGEWHIDHIIPIKSFFESGEEDPSVINALCNLQPIWASENMRKGCRIDNLL